MRKDHGTSILIPQVLNKMSFGTPYDRLTSRLMNCERNICAVGTEIIIRGENGDGMAGGNGAEKKIRVGALHTDPTADIEKISSCFVIFRHERKINKCPQLVAQVAKLGLFANTG